MSINKNHSESIFLYGMVLSMFCWGLSWSSGKILTSYGGPLQISFLRFLTTFLALLIILIFTKEKLSIARNGLTALFCASILIGLYTFLFFKGLIAGKAGAGGVLVTILNPIISYFIMLLYTRRFPTKKEAIGLFLGIIAGCILLNIFFEPHLIFQGGNSYFLLASFTWALLSLITAKSVNYGSPVVFSLWMYGLCSILLGIILLIINQVELIKKTDFVFGFNLFFSGVVVTAFATTFYFVATSKIGASKASSFIFMVPLSAALGSWIFLGEQPLLHTLIGGALGIAAVYMINKK